MTTFEDFFNKSVLSVIAPESSVGFPKQDDPSTWPEWLNRIEAEDTDRKLAFFDEQLEFILTIHFEQSSLTGDIDPQKPPADLLSYLAHLQVSYEASYISSIASSQPGYTTELSRPPVPPRAHSLNTNVRASTTSNKSSPIGLTVPGQQQHPSIFPPHTPHPIPSTAESDRQYVQAQGTPLRTGIWGEGTNTSETFALIWSKSRYAWVAVFRMSIQVAFLPTKMSDPLLCLTVSTTLRDKLVPVTRAREPLQALIESAGEPASPSDARSPISPTANDGQDELGGLEEINLLEGLTVGATFSSSESPLSLPSTRLGISTRQQSFALLADPKTASTPQTVTPSNSRQSGIFHATLRKSFRKTLRTVSGFQIRMRTVFVPYFMLPQAMKKESKHRTVNEDDSDEETDLEVLRERELIEHGADEHTVVLCVEVSNSGDSEAGFAIEGVDVSVSGDGAKAHLIGWGEAGFTLPDSVFPLLLAPREQYNLLYAVTFVRSPEIDEFSLARGKGLPASSALPELQRAVVIIINGRPCFVNEDVEDGSQLHLAKFSYPTQTFPSRWNCVLDLSPQAPKLADGEGQRTTLPEPASPFPSAPTKARPASASFTQTTPKLGVTLASPTVAGSKRHTFSAMDSDAESPKYRGLLSPVNYRSETSMLNPSNQRDPSAQTGSLPSSSATLTPPANPIANRSSYAPPSVVAKAFGGNGSRTPTTTYGPLDNSLPSLPSIQRSRPYGHVAEDSVGGQISLDGVPRTPAYPAFPITPPPPTPHWQGPLASQQSGPVGPSVEIRREKGANNAGIPPTPGPRISAAGAFSQSDSFRDVVNADGRGEPIIVSVGLLWKEDDVAGLPGKIYPLDKFTLDIFVFNRSSWTRRFEVSYPDTRERRKERELLNGEATEQDGLASPGIIATENRVRIGPLLPSTCQSVRMDFLALTPGVHSIESLTLTDIQSGYVMHLRSVMDVIVHEYELSQPA